jgi:hypothetical protein
MYCKCILLTIIIFYHKRHSFVQEKLTLFIQLSCDSGIYSPNVYHGFAREFIKDLERMR